MYTDMLSNIFLKTNSGLLGVKRHTDSKDLIYSRNIEYGKYLFLNPFFCSYLSIVLQTPWVTHHPSLYSILESLSSTSLRIEHKDSYLKEIWHVCFKQKSSQMPYKYYKYQTLDCLTLSKILPPNHSESNSIFQNLFPALILFDFPGIFFSFK